MDFPGVVRNPLPLVRFRQKDRFSTPLVEKRPAPPTPWPERSNFNFSKKSSTSHQKPIIHRGFTVTPCRLKAARHTPNNPRYSRDEPGTDCGHLGARFAPLRFPRLPPTTTAHRTPTFALQIQKSRANEREKGYLAIFLRLQTGTRASRRPEIPPTSHPWGRYTGNIYQQLLAVTCMSQITYKHGYRCQMLSNCACAFAFAL